MKKSKTVFGVLNLLLIVAFYYFSIPAYAYFDYHYELGTRVYAENTNTYKGLNGFFIAFAIITIITTILSIVFNHIKSENKKIEILKKIFDVSAVISTVIAGGVGLYLAIFCAVSKDGLLFVNIPISGVLLLFAIIFTIIVFVSDFKKNNEKEENYVFNNLSVIELDLSKTIDRTVQISAVSNVGVGLWTNICYSLCQIFGKKSATYQKKMNRIKDDALKQLLAQANSIGANTITDINYAISNLTIIATGTAIYYKE